MMVSAVAGTRRLSQSHCAVLELTEAQNLLYWTVPRRFMEIVPVSGEVNEGVVPPSFAVLSMPVPPKPECDIFADLPMRRSRGRRFSLGARSLDWNHLVWKLVNGSILSHNHDGTRADGVVDTSVGEVVLSIARRMSTKSS
jgi:hypothetical protein